MHRAGEVGRVEGAYVVSGVLEHPADIAEEGSLGIGDEEVGVCLHEVGLDVVARLARSGAAEHADVAVAVVLEVEALRLEREREVPREQDVVRLVFPVHERSSLLEGSPAGGAVLLALAVRARAHEAARPDRPGYACGHEAHGKRHGLRREPRFGNRRQQD